MRWRDGLVLLLLLLVVGGEGMLEIGRYAGVLVEIGIRRMG
jgi:hypothetical protein